MTTNVIQKTGVARLSILIILIFVIFHKGHCRPAASNIPLNMEPHSKTNIHKPYDPKKAPEEMAKLPTGLPWNKTTKKPTVVQGQKLFLVTKNSSWLEILPNGTIRGNTCKTKYGMLESHSHEGALVLKGTASGQYLCMSSAGVLYTVDNFNPENCGFLIKPRYENKKAVEFYTYGHHLHHKVVGNLTQRYFIGINCNGQPIVVSTKEQRKNNKDYIRFIQNKEGLDNKSPDDFPETCEKSKCPSDNPHSSGGVNPDPQKSPKRNYLKFCREIRRRFFQASLKELRRFSKRDCWKRLSKARRRSRRRDKSKSGKHKRRHRRRLTHSSHRYSADPT